MQNQRYRFKIAASISMMVFLVVTSLFLLQPSTPSIAAVAAAPGASISSPGIAPSAADPVIAAAGDIACDPGDSVFNSGKGNSNACRQMYTSNLLVNAGLAAVLDLGDNQYYCGGLQAYLQSYDLSWGRLKSITHPSVGNHEYLTSGGTGCDRTNGDAAGYFAYFGSAAGNPGQGYYSFNVGDWHIIALNSNCGNIGGCTSSSPQGKWLTADLKAHPNYCTLAFWHIPLFSSGGRAAINSQPLWQTLYSHDVDVILNGHDHIYERFAPQDPNGLFDPVKGMREFIVGTGGANHTSIAAIAPNSELTDTTSYGVLKLTLHPAGYDWKFVPSAGDSFTDSGTGLCHGVNPPTPTPAVTATRANTATPRPTRTPRPSSTPAPQANPSEYFLPIIGSH
jgi:acid phosphatase type 7